MNEKGTNSAEIKDILLEDISLCIKHLHFISTPSNTGPNDPQVTPNFPDENNSEQIDIITNETPSFQALMFQLDMILLHNLNRVDRGYWPFLKTFSHNNVITSIGQLTLVRTPIGRGRAWLHIALNDHLMESYFRLFLEDSKPIRSYYRSDAFVRDQERMKLLQTLVSGLDFINFDLKTNCNYLDKRACISEQFLAHKLQFETTNGSKGSFHSERDLESSISSINSLTKLVPDRKSPQNRNPSPFLSERHSEDLEIFITKNNSNNSSENGEYNEDRLIGRSGVARPVIQSKRHYFSQEKQNSASGIGKPMRKVSSCKEEYIDDANGLVTHMGRGKKHRRHKKRQSDGIQRLSQESQGQSTWSLDDNGGSLADNSSMADTTSLASDFADQLDMELNAKNENSLSTKHNYLQKKSISPIPILKEPEISSIHSNEGSEDVKIASSPSEIVIIVDDNSSEDLQATELVPYPNNTTIYGSKHTTDISSLEEISLDTESGRLGRNVINTFSDTSSYDAVTDNANERRIVSPLFDKTNAISKQDENSDSSLSHIIERLEASKAAGEFSENNTSKSPSPIQLSKPEVFIEDKSNPRINPISQPDVTAYCSDTESEQHSKESKTSTPSIKPVKLETSIERRSNEIIKPQFDDSITPFSESKDFEGLLAGYLDTAKDDAIPNVPTSFEAFYTLDQQERVRTEKVVGISLFDPSPYEGIDSLLEDSIRDDFEEPRNVTPLSFVDLNLGGDDIWGVDNEIEVRERSKSVFGDENEGFSHFSSLIKRPDREIKPVEEVKISHNNQLMLRVTILISQEEKILKVFRAFDSQYLGLFRIIYILITDQAVYTMKEDGVQGTFCKLEVISYSELDYITIGINWQLITILKKNFKTLTCYTGNEQLSKCILAAIRQGMAAGINAKLTLNVVENDIKRINKICSLLEMKDSQEVKHFSIVTSGPLRGRFTSQDDEKDPGGYDHDKGLSGYQCWRKQGMFSRWTDSYFVLNDSTLSQFNLKTEMQPKLVLNLKGGSAGCRRLSAEGDKFFIMEVTSRDAISIRISIKSEEELICWIQGICEEVAGREIQESKAHSQSLVMNCGLVLTPDLLCLTLEHEESVKKLSLSYVMDLNEIQVEEEKPYCILKFDSIDWLLCFSSEYELGRFERCLAFQWENVYKVALSFTQVSDQVVLLRANQLMELMAGAAQRSDSVTRNRLQPN